MKLEEGKLILTEEELKLVKRANMFANSLYAGAWLHNAMKAKSLEEGADARDAKYYAECVDAYRKKNYEVI